MRDHRKKTRRYAWLAPLLLIAACIPSRVTIVGDDSDAGAIDARVEDGRGDGDEASLDIGDASDTLATDTSVIDTPVIDTLERDTIVTDTIVTDTGVAEMDVTDVVVTDGFDGCLAQPERCNGRDDDCDGRVDNGFDLATDALNCGACGRACGTGFSCVAARCGNEAIHSSINHAPEQVHSCTTLRSGQVWCWGGNLNEAVTPGSASPAAAPTALPMISDAVQTALSPATTCVLHRRAGGAGGDVTCFGRSVPWLDPGGVQRRYNTTRGVRIVGGSQFVCVLGDDARVRCWGVSGRGQLGSSVALNAIITTPTEVTGLTAVTTLAAGDAHVCALTESGAVSCWGACNGGQCGTGTTNQSERNPTVVNGLPAGDPVVELAAGTTASCARTTRGAIYCWGSTGSATPALVTAASGALPAFSSLAGGHQSFCASSVAGDVYCWGQNLAGLINSTQLGAAGAAVRIERVIDAPVNVTALAVGGDSACAIDGRGAVRCWGSNAWMQLGITRPLSSAEPRLVAGLTGATRLALGTASSCAQTAAGVVCWGNGAALGGGAISPGSSVPQPVAGLPPGATLASGGGLSHCVISSGELRCWGRALLLARGQGTNTPITTAVSALTSTSPETALTDVTESSAQSDARCARTGAGAAFCTGLNTTGLLGEGSTTHRFVMTPVLGLSSNVRSIVAGYGHSCGLRVDGRALCWGQNQHGQLGDGTTLAVGTYRMMPGPLVDDALLGIAEEIAVSQGATCARSSTGAVFCWGNNGLGEAGLGASSGSSRPTRLASLMGVVSQLVAGRTSFCARVSDAVHCWGDNSVGQLGDRTFTTRREPTPVASLPSVAEVASGQFHRCARTVAGAVYCWGDNTSGQLGDGAPLFWTRAVSPTGLP